MNRRSILQILATVPLALLAKFSPAAEKFDSATKALNTRKSFSADQVDGHCDTILYSAACYGIDIEDLDIKAVHADYRDTLMSMARLKA